MAKTRNAGVKTPSFSVDPLYAAQDADKPPLITAGYAFQEPLAIREPSFDDTAAPKRIPARFKKQVPVLLDVSVASDHSLTGPALLEQITSLQLYTGDRKRLLATWMVATDGALSTTYKSDFMTDIGAVFTTTQHLRCELPKAVYAPLFATPSTELLVVGVDGQGRTAVVQSLTGRAGERTLWVDGEVLSFDPDKKYDDPARLYDWRFNAALTSDEPVSKPGPQDAKTRVAVTPRQSRISPMVLDLSCKIQAGTASEPPIKAIRTVYVFDDQDVLLETCSAKDDGVYSRGEDHELGTNALYSYEHLRIGLKAAIAAPYRKDSSLSLHVIAVDTRGRTIMTGFPNCY